MLPQFSWGACDISPNKPAKIYHLCIPDLPMLHFAQKNDTLQKIQLSRHLSRHAKILGAIPPMKECILKKP